MILKSIPGFCFVDPTNRETINIRFASVNVTAETRRIRAIWQPELVRDLQAFQNIDAEAELTALLTENHWAHVLNLIHQGNRAPQDIQPPDFGHIALPVARRVMAQTVGLDLVPVQPLPLPDLNFLDYLYAPNQDYTALPNEEGWFTNGTFDSLLIKTDMQPFHFILPRHLRNRRRRRR